MKKINYKILLTSIQAIAAVIAIFAVYSENVSKYQILLIGLGYFVILVIVTVLGYILREK